MYRLLQRVCLALSPSDNLLTFRHSKVYPGQDIDQLLDLLPGSDEDIRNESLHEPEDLGKGILSPQSDFIKLSITQAIPSYLSSPTLPSEEFSDDAEEAEDDLTHIALAKHLGQLQITIEPVFNHFFGPARFVKSHT